MNIKDLSWSIIQSRKLDSWPKIGSRRDGAGPARAAERQLATFLLLTLVAIALLRDVYLLFRHSAATGVDGYYYVLQIEHLSAHQGLFFPTPTPLALYLLSTIHSLAGDPALALKLGALAVHLSLCLGVYTLVRLLTRSQFYALSGVALVATSNLHLFFLSEFLSNSVAIASLIWSGCFAILAKQRESKVALAAACLCAFFAIFSHRSSIFLLAVLAGSFVLFRLVMFPGATWSRKVAGWALSVSLFFAPLILASQPVFVLPDWLSTQLLSLPRIAVAGRLALLEKTLVLIASISVLITVRKKRLSPAEQFSGAIAVMSLLLTLNPFLNRNTGWLSVAERLSGLAYIQLAILMPAFFFFARTVLMSWAVPACLALAILFFAISLQMDLPWGLRDEYMARRTQLIETLRGNLPKLHEAELVIAPHGDQFVVSYILGVPAQQKLETNLQHTPYWLLQHLSGIEIRDCEGTIALDHDIVLVRDDCLDDLLRELGTAEIRDILPHNPHLIGRLSKQVQSSYNMVQRHERSGQ